VAWAAASRQCPRRGGPFGLTQRPGSPVTTARSLTPQANKLSARVNERGARNFYLAIGEAKSDRLDAPCGYDRLAAFEAGLTDFQ